MRIFAGSRLVLVLAVSFLSASPSLATEFRFRGPDVIASSPGSVETVVVTCELAVDQVTPLCGYSVAAIVSGAEVVDVRFDNAEYLYTGLDSRSGRAVLPDDELDGLVAEASPPQEECLALEAGEVVPLLEIELEVVVGPGLGLVTLEFAEDALTPAAAFGADRVENAVRSEEIELTPELSSLAIPVATGATFRRGDSNSDGVLNVSDSSNIFNYLFFGTTEILCADAADSNDDGQINISDGIAPLRWFFFGDVQLPFPSPNCGPDPTDDGLRCDRPLACEGVTLEWASPTENEDGTVLKDLAGYRLHYGPRRGRYDYHVDIGKVTEYRLLEPPGAPLFLSITAYDVWGNESEFSEEIRIDF